MKKKVDHQAADSSTEEKIKEAARKLFTQKGFAATKTRDIATEAGINLALLNYYFRSKEKLFNLIMLENLQEFKNGIVLIFNDEETSLDEKIESFVGNYIDLLIQQPDIPLFIFNEIRSNPEKHEKAGLRDVVLKSYFMKQLQSSLQSKKATIIDPFQIMISMVGLTVFPFIASPMIKAKGRISETKFIELMKERKKLIPIWIKAMLKAN